MQRNQAVTIELTPEISAIFRDYESARPQKDSGLSMSASYQTFSPDSNDEGLFSKAAARVTDAVVAGELGAVGGQAGVVAGAGIAIGKTLAGHLYERTTKKKTIQIFNVAYLKSDELAKLEANPFIGVSAEQSKSRLDMLKKLYHHACTYQKLKGTRFGLNLYFFTIGEHRDDSLINDPKYLVNILIGRKLVLAANAKSKEEYDLHIKHLRNFLKEVVKRDDILQSKSDDSTYLSIRNVINMVNKYLVDQADKEEQTADNDTLFDLLQQHVDQSLKNSAKLYDDIIDRTTRLVCDIDPEEFRQYTRDTTFTCKLDISKKLANHGSHYNVLLTKLFGQDFISDDNLSTLIAGLKKYAGIEEFRNENSFKTIFKQIVENKKRLHDLLAALKKFEGIKAKAGLDAFITLSDQLAYLLQEIKKSQFALVKAQRALVDELSKYTSDCKSQEFKNAFTRHGYDRLTSDIKPINEAIIALEQISLNKEDIKAKLDGEIASSITDFQKDLSNLGFLEIKPATAPEDHTEPEAEQDDDDALKDWVEVNLEKSGVEFAKQLPENVKDLSWFKKMFSDTELRHKYEEQQKELKKKDAMIAALKVEKQTAESAKKASDAEKAAAKSAQQEAERNAAAITSTKELHDSIEAYRATFNKFINDYVKKNKASSIWSFFTHFHGTHGLGVAGFILSEFNSLVDDLNKRDITHENLHSTINEWYKSMLQLHKKNLDGNFNPHSLKTYLYAFSEYLRENPAKNQGALETYYEDAIIKTRMAPETIERLYRTRFLPETLGILPSL